MNKQKPTKTTKRTGPSSPAPVRRALFERLENRALFAAGPDLMALVPAAWDAFAGAPMGPTAPVKHPAVTSAAPGGGATGVLRDAFVSAEVYVPNGGIDAASLTSQTVYLYRTGTGQRIPAVLNTSGGGDVIVLRPKTILAANTQYTFALTEGVTDVVGVSFGAYSTTFTTGTGLSVTDAAVNFQPVALPNTQGRQYLSVAIGPDDRLYAGTSTGHLLRFPINADGTLGDPLDVTSILSANGGAARFVEGIAFDPSSTKDHVVLWVTTTAAATDQAPDWTGKISRVSGANLETVEDKVIHLPRSARDHVTNQPVFGPDGAIYFSQPSNSAMGQADPAWENRPEHLLSASILRLDPRKLAAGATLDALTPDGGGTYNPFAAGAPLTIYASGVRNAYDLVWHSNGSLYAPTNGSAAGGSTPAGGGAPGLENVPDAETDYLFRIKQGAYYGHPNPLQNHYVLNGGNPTDGTDPFEVPSYPVGTRPDAKWQPAVFDFGPHESPDGAIEYVGTAFAGRLDHKILVVRYSGGGDIAALGVNPDGTISGQSTGMTGLTGLVNPVDLTEHLSNGDLYVSEYGGQRLTLLRPIGGGGVETGGGVDAATGAGGTVDPTPTATPSPTPSPSPTPTPAPTPTPTAAPTRTPRERRTLRAVQTFAAAHAMALPDLNTVVGHGLTDLLDELKDEARRDVLTAKVTTLAARKSYTLPDVSGYTVKQLKDLRRAVRRA